MLCQVVLVGSYSPTVGLHLASTTVDCATQFESVVSDCQNTLLGTYVSSGCSSGSALGTTVWEGTCYAQGAKHHESQHLV